MKKFLVILLSCYFVYGLAVSIYIFYGSDSSLPVVYKGSAADPELFMTDRELELSQEFSQIKNIIYFLRIPLEWGAYLAILIFGLSNAFEKWAKKRKFFIVQTAIFVFFISLFVRIIYLPIDIYSYKVSVAYGVATQSMASWFKDVAITFLVNLIVMTIVIATIVFLLKKAKQKWWVYTWLLSIPFTVFFMYFQPVIIAPLFNDFYELQNKELQSEILELANEAGIPAERVYEVNMSEKTNAMNAYVTGIGSNLRIVLWDTTLEKLEKDEVLFIMAHEIGHYVKNHLLLSLLGSIASTFFGLYVSNRLLQWSLNKWGENLKIHSQASFAIIPALLLIFSLLTFVSTPVSNVISRYHELEADRFAIEMTKDPDAAIGSFQALTKAGLSDVNPPTVVKWLRYTHPTMLERLIFLESFRNNSQ
ncbi:peptidase M48 [Lottiidibacillus patelloidae]|uniref:Peptidase M48 n=1 Tax=Lottiidibacillus patelloidae TaxID=2670334 RepID=A0A263BWV8_9BACI|nr:M48 family metallopeptidase [Lottiidibacillus patelloidae]OZM58194.1 peptidase M48 [Lottiidibacillus patelloidae]